jgi:hypothetical protein
MCSPFDEYIKMRTLVIVAILAALTVLFIPISRFQSLHDVTVNFSFIEDTPTARAITINGDSFTVPPGQSVERVLRLKGGGNSALVYTTQGWAFPRHQIIVDGEDIPRDRIYRSNESGNIRILGLGRSPSMDVKIDMQDPAASSR